MNRLQLLLAILGFSISLTLTAQNKHFDKANKQYKERRYTQAINSFEKGLELDYNIRALSKLANCYRMNNKMEKAEELFSEVVKQEKARSKDFLYYAETLMGNGKYGRAKEWFLKYEAIEGDGKGKRFAANCDEVKLIVPFFSNVFIEEFQFNSEGDDTSPVFFKDDIIFSSDRNMGVRLLKQKSGWTGRDYINLYVSKKNQTGDYDKPKLYSSKLNALNKNTACASFLPSGEEVYFTQNSSHSSRKDTYNMQLFQATSKDGNRWKSTDVLPFCTIELNYMHPAISPDGESLFFVTNKAGGEGGTDIYVAKRKGEKWTRPQNIGAHINTPDNEGFPFMSQDGKLYFCSKGHPGYGGFDIFFTEENEEGVWSTPVNVGRPINSPNDDISIFFKDNNREGLFTSSRSGGDDDIYFFEINSNRTPKDLGEEELIFASNDNQKTNVSDQGITEVEVVENVSKLEPVENEIDPESLIESTEELEVEMVESVSKLKTNENEIDPESLLESNKKNEKESFDDVSKTETIEKEIEQKMEIVKEDTIEDSAISKGSKTESVDKGTELKIPTKPKAEVETQVTEKKVEDFVYNNQESLPVEEVNPLEDKVKDSISLPVVPKISDQQQQKPDLGNKRVTAEEFYNLLMECERENKSLLGEKFTLKGFNYTDQKEYKVNEEHKKILDQLSVTLKNYERLRLEVIAHTESFGKESSNRTIAYYRAAAIATYLQSTGIIANKVTAKGKGESEILNHCLEGVECSQEEHLVNRRIEIRISGF